MVKCHTKSNEIEKLLSSIKFGMTISNIIYKYEMKTYHKDKLILRKEHIHTRKPTTKPHWWPAWLVAAGHVITQTATPGLLLVRPYKKGCYDMPSTYVDTKGSHSIYGWAGPRYWGGPVFFAGRFWERKKFKIIFIWG